MTKRYTLSHRTKAAEAIFVIDSFWAHIFADTGVSDLNYCDLFTQMWLKRKGPPPAKTDLYALMPNIRRRTAVKYVQSAIDRGMLTEHESATDRRLRLVTLTPPAASKVERFLDHTCSSFSLVGK